MHDTIGLFKAAMQAAGLEPPDRIEPGRFHRFPGIGKGRNDDAGWCKLFDDGRGGVFGDFSSGLDESWQCGHGRTYSAEEREAFRRRCQEDRQAREVEERQRHERVSAEAAQILTNTFDDPAQHPYAQKKAVPFGPLVKRGEWPQRGWTDALLVPVYQAAGQIGTVQAISSTGEKDFLAGGRKRGGFHPLGKVRGASRVLIGEGLATIAAVHAVEGSPAVAAMDAGNLLHVARAVQELAPDADLVFLADNDVKEDGSNVGLAAAIEAARTVGGVVALPRLDGRKCDFWDVWQEGGANAVRACLAPIPLESRDAQVTGVQASTALALDRNTTEEIEDTGVSVPDIALIPGESERPAFRVFDEWLDVNGNKYRPGVWHFGIKPGKRDEPMVLTQQWICSPLHVDAITFDGQGNNFGRLLRFRNTLGRWREWAMPMELLRGSGDELRGELLSMGVEIDPTERQLFPRYLQGNPPKRRMRCALQVGWCGDSFVLPDRVIGPSASGVIFQSGERGVDEYTLAGSLDGWRAEIAARAVGNPLLVLDLSAAFSGPLLSKCNVEGGGLHFVGDSSTGKTTLLEAACSIWGGPSYRRSWRATANGMEGAAALFNDGLLALDEISECDPREVGAIVYALGNGRGKQRASRTGSARSVMRWRCFIVSSGERTIATTMQEVGQRAKAGQNVRILDIPAARQFGCFDELHGFTSGAALADAVKRAAINNHGFAGRAFLDRLARDNQDFSSALERFKALPEFSAEDGEGQDKRAAARFALMALAGELATEYEVTGWPQGEAFLAAAEGFRLWRAMRGKGNDERRQILDHVSAFIERHGDGRFSDVDSEYGNRLRDRAGWWRESIQGREYLFTADGMREALKGFDFNRALDVLQTAGVLPTPGADGKRAKPFRIGGRSVRLYPVQAERLG